MAVQSSPQQFRTSSDSHAGAQIKESAESAAEGLKQRGEDFVSEQKSKAANELTSLGAAARSAAEKLREVEDPRAAHYADMAADRLEGVARHLGERDLGSLVRGFEQTARRRPELFLGGMFLLGLGVSRFLKASRPDDDRTSRSTARLEF